MKEISIDFIFTLKHPQEAEILLKKITSSRRNNVEILTLELKALIIYVQWSDKNSLIYSLFIESPQYQSSILANLQ